MPRNYQHKLKPLTSELRQRMLGLPVPGILTLEKEDFKPTPRWFTGQNQGTGATFSIRRLDDRLFVFRIK